MECKHTEQLRSHVSISASSHMMSRRSCDSFESASFLSFFERRCRGCCLMSHLVSLFWWLAEETFRLSTFYWASNHRQKWLLSLRPLVEVVLQRDRLLFEDPSFSQDTPTFARTSSRWWQGAVCLIRTNLHLPSPCHIQAGLARRPAAERECRPGKA